MATKKIFARLDRKMIKIALTLLLTFTLSHNAWADRPKVGLVLGGGGARGAAHVGVLKVLEREHIAIDYIAGTSMGAVVGALYASGNTAAEIEEILHSIDWQLALSDTGPRSAHSISSKKNDLFEHCFTYRPFICRFRPGTHYFLWAR